MNGYCPKCKKQTKMNNPQYTKMKNGCARASGKCDCGCKMSKIMSRDDTKKLGTGIWSDIGDSFPLAIPFMSSVGLL